LLSTNVSVVVVCWTVIVVIFEKYFSIRMCPRLNTKKSIEEQENRTQDQELGPGVACDRCGAKLSTKYSLKRHVSPFPYRIYLYF
jgi:uncharacterized protein involved in copper resistance